MFKKEIVKLLTVAGMIGCMTLPTMTSFARQWIDCGAVWRYYTDDGQYRGWMDEATGEKFFLNQYGDMSVGYQPLTADENGTITWHYFTEDEGEADAFRDFPTYGHLLTGYQIVHGVRVYFSENQAENGKLYTDTVTPDGRTADHVGIIR